MKRAANCIALPLCLCLFLPLGALAGPGGGGDCPCDCSSFEGCGEGDGDCIPDAQDNCIDVCNPSQCDTDADGYGNHCDGDFNNDGGVSGSPDFAPHFLADFNSGIDSGTGTDMNCDGGVSGAPDFSDLFLDQFEKGSPGPSCCAP